MEVRKDMIKMEIIRYLVQKDMNIFERIYKEYFKAILNIFSSKKPIIATNDILKYL